MITEEMMKAAAQEADRALMEQLSGLEKPVHKFSKRFQKKMRKLLFREKHPVFSGILRTAAAVGMALVLGGGLLLPFRGEIRAKISGWVLERNIGTATYFCPEGTPEGDRQWRYRLTEIPEGYEEYETNQIEEGEFFIYINEQDQFLKFAYLYNSDEMMFSLLVSGDERKNVKVGDCIGDLYISNDSEEGNSLVWRDENTLFCLDGFFDPEELVKMAERIEAYQ